MKVQPVRAAALHNASCCRSTTVSAGQCRRWRGCLTRRTVCSYLRSLCRGLVYPLQYRLKRFPNLFRHCYFPHTVIRDTEVSVMTTIDFQNKSLPKEERVLLVAPLLFQICYFSHRSVSEKFRDNVLFSVFSVVNRVTYLNWLNTRKK